MRFHESELSWICIIPFGFRLKMKGTEDPRTGLVEKGKERERDESGFIGKKACLVVGRTTKLSYSAGLGSMLGLFKGPALFRPDLDLIFGPILYMGWD